MTDSDRCRATAARYARMASLCPHDETRVAYLDLERLWLEAARWTEKLQLKDDESARRRIYELIDRSGSHLREIQVSVH